MSTYYAKRHIVAPLDDETAAMGSVDITHGSDFDTVRDGLAAYMEREANWNEREKSPDRAYALRKAAETVRREFTEEDFSGQYSRKEIRTLGLAFGIVRTDYDRK